MSISLVVVLPMRPVSLPDPPVHMARLFEVSSIMYPMSCAPSKKFITCLEMFESLSQHSPATA